MFELTRMLWHVLRPRPDQLHAVCLQADPAAFKDLSNHETHPTSQAPYYTAKVMRHSHIHHHLSDREL